MSDHEPIILDIELNLDRYAHGARSFTPTPVWRKESHNDFKRYQQSLVRTCIISDEQLDDLNFSGTQYIGVFLNVIVVSLSSYLSMV